MRKYLALLFVLSVMLLAACAAPVAPAATGGEEAAATEAPAEEAAAEGEMADGMIAGLAARQRLIRPLGSRRSPLLRGGI